MSSSDTHAMRGDDISFRSGIYFGFDAGREPLEGDMSIYIRMPHSTSVSQGLVISCSMAATSAMASTNGPSWTLYMPQVYPTMRVSKKDWFGASLLPGLGI